MSKYRYNFHVSTGYVGSKVSEDVDLVEDWNEVEAELDEMAANGELEEYLVELYNTWLWNAIEGGFGRIE